MAWHGRGMTWHGRGMVLDQLANLHFHFTSVPRCTPMVWRYNGTPMEILHLVWYRRDVPVGVPLDLSTPTGMSCIGA